MITPDILPNSKSAPNFVRLFEQDSCLLVFFSHKAELLASAQLKEISVHVFI